jgi:hypothetical protein
MVIVRFRTVKIKWITGEDKAGGYGNEKNDHEEGFKRIEGRRYSLIPVAPEQLHDTDFLPGLLFIPFPLPLGPGQGADIVPDDDPCFCFDKPVLAHGPRIEGEPGM